MNKLLTVLLATVVAGGAFAQSAGTGGSHASDATVTTGQGATSEGTLPSSGGAIIRPGSPGSSTTTMGSSGTASGSTATSPASTSAPSGKSMGHGAKDCPPGLDKKDNGCLPSGQATKQQP